MNEGQSTRQQIVEKIKGSANILVTVSSNPSVDALAAALGLTIMLNGMKKHATAVVSGDIPPAISFLEPDKTFENTVDSLRDFIIALDKEKADHLRYKVDGDVVKIFITPYRTTISQDDLDFSQGDYNVELVLALGVNDKEHLDKALAAHGRILHDATVTTLTCGDSPSSLGSLDWHDPNASSLSEMLVAVSEALKSDKPVLDEQSATAFLTGIVAATDRFSNNRTSSKVMTMAAQLMAAGANQQLIAAKLEEAHEIGPDKDDSSSSDDSNNDGTTDLEEGESTKLDKKPKKKEAKKDDGELSISHEKEGDLDEVAEQVAEENQEEAAKKAEEELADQLQSVAPVADKPSVEDLQKDLASASADVEHAAAQPATDGMLPPVQQEDEPMLGGTLNATAEQAHEDAEAERAKDRNKTILSHNSGAYVGDQNPSFQSPFNATNVVKEEPKSVSIFDDAKPAVNLDQPGERKAEPKFDLPTETLEDIDKKNRAQAHDDARAEIEQALNEAPFDPANQPIESVGAQQFGGSLHSDAQVPQEPQQSAPAPQPSEFMPPELPQVQSPFSTDVPQQPESGPIDFSVLPPPPPLPNFDAPQSGPLPPEQLGQILPPAEPVPQSDQEAPAPADPNQFKIPGQ